MKPKITNIAKLCILFANAVLVFTIAILFFCTLLFIFGKPIQTNVLISAGMAACGFIGWNTRSYFEKHRLPIFLFVAVLLAIVIVAAIMVSSQFRELSSDGDTFHSEARVLFANGFNPFYDHTLDERTDQYPVAPWVYATVIYQLTGSIDSSRVFNILFWAAGFCAALALFINLFKGKVGLAVIMSLVCVLNPVIITQSLSFYVDGQLGLMLLVVIAYSLLLSQKFDLPALLGLGMAVILAINIKLTGSVYACLFSGGLLGWSILINRWLPGFRHAARKTTLLEIVRHLWVTLHKEDKFWIVGLAGSGVIGVAFFGYPAYIQPPIEYGSLMGYFNQWGQLLLNTNALPTNWVSFSPLQQFFYSIFSESLVTSNVEAHLKWPLMFSEKEWLSFIYGEHRAGGFGPLFGSVMILSLLAMPFAIALTWRSKDQVWLVMGAPLLILVSTLIASMAWISRFVPQFWLFPVFIVVSLFLLDDRRQYTHCMAWIIVVVMLYNSFIVANSYLSQQRQVTIELDQHFNLMKKEGKREPILFYYANRTYLSIYLTEKNVWFEPVADSKYTCSETMIKSKLPFPLDDCWYCYRN